jgi:hypothetical protein
MKLSAAAEILTFLLALGKTLKDFFGVLGEFWIGFLVTMRQNSFYGRLWPS